MADPYAAFEDVDDPYAAFEDVADEQPEGRYGDALKPYFGGHNPLAETYDVFAKPFVEGEQQPEIDARGGLERVGDTAAFLASVPVRMATRGQYGAGDIVGAVSPNLGQRVQAGEQDFVGANEAELRALQAAGELSLGTFGVPVPRVQVPKAPARQPVRPAQAPQPTQTQPAIMPSSRAVRARQYVSDLDELGISRHGPAIAQAARDAESLGPIARVTEELPLVSKPLRESTRGFVESSARAADELAGGFAPGGKDITRAGSRLQSYLDDFKKSRVIDKDDFVAMTDDEVRAIARRSVPELGSFKNAQDARYELAIRAIPEGMRRGGTQTKAGVRTMINPTNTRAVLNEIQGRSKGMLGKTGKGKGTDAEAAPIASGGLLGGIVRGIKESKERTYSIQDLRNIRSEIRRRGSKIADTEAAALNKGDLARLEKSLTIDLRQGIVRMSQDANKIGNAQLSKQLAEAGRLYKAADDFTRRNSEAWKEIQAITKKGTEGQAIHALMKAAEQGKSGNPRMLRAYRQFVPVSVKDDVAAAVINEMGALTKQAHPAMKEIGLSVANFSKDFANWSDAGLTSVFGHKPQLLAKLRKLANVGKGMEGYEKLANVSRSGHTTLAGLILLGGPLSLSMVLKAGAAGYGMARFLTSEAYVSWLTRNTVLQKSFNKGTLKGRDLVKASRDQVRRLRKIVTRDKGIDAETQRAILISIDQAESDLTNAR